MSDPRGHGLGKKGHGKWHAPKPKPIVIDPVKLGWQRVETEQEQYTLGDVILQPCLQGGWLTIQTATIGGREIKYRSVWPYEFLPALTVSFKRELAVA